MMKTWRALFRGVEVAPSSFASRGEADFADRAVSAMRFELGDHEENLS